MRRDLRTLATAGLFVAWIAGVTAPALAGGPWARRRGTVVVETVAPSSRPQDRVAPTGMLGSFTPSPYVDVRDNGVLAQGRSPLGAYGRENSLSVYGPLSAFRQTSAPVDLVVRGYDGVPSAVRGTGFSNPLRPELSPFIYPTRASHYSALRYQTTSPSRDKAILWIDLN